MKLSFSTRGWGDLSWEELIDSALDMKFTGIEIYNPFKNPALTDRGGPFHKYHCAATIRQLRDRKLSIPCIDTSLDLSVEDSESVAQMMRLARDLKVAYVVAWASTGNEEQINANVSRLLSLAEELGVCLLIKTSGIYADTTRLRSLLVS